MIIFKPHKSYCKRMRRVTFLAGKESRCVPAGSHAPKQRKTKQNPPYIMLFSQRAQRHLATIPEVKHNTKWGLEKLSNFAREFKKGLEIKEKKSHRFTNKD